MMSHRGLISAAFVQASVMVSAFSQNDGLHKADEVSLLQHGLEVQQQVDEGHQVDHLTSLDAADLTKLVDKVYYINLDGSVERRAAMESQLAQLERETGLQYQRFSAINGSIDPWVQGMMLNDTARESRVNVGAGTLGCFRSHMLLWQEIHATDTAANANVPPYSLILEDDVVLNATLLSMLPARLLSVPEDHNMVLLDSWGSKREDDHAGEGVYRASPPFAVHLLGPGYAYYYAGTHAYLLRHEDLGRISEWMETSAPSWAMDAATAYNVTGVRKYAFQPTLAGQPADKAETEEIRELNHPDGGGLAWPSA